MKFLTSLFTLLALSSSVFSADDTCALLQKEAEEFNKKMPFLADEVTENFLFTVNCPNKIVGYKKRLLVDYKLFKDG